MDFLTTIGLVWRSSSLNDLRRSTGGGRRLIEAGATSKAFLSSDDALLMSSSSAVQKWKHEKSATYLRE